MNCTCSDNAYGRIGYCPVHEAPRGRSFEGVSVWNTIKPWLIVAVFVAAGGAAFIHAAGF